MRNMDFILTLWEAVEGIQQDNGMTLFVFKAPFAVWRVH